MASENVVIRQAERVGELDAVEPASALRCGRCVGGVTVHDDDDDRHVTDVCYHCGGTGFVDEETAFHDELRRLAGYYAFRAAHEYRRVCDEDPDGEDFAFHAAENMMTAHDALTEITRSYEDKFVAQLLALPYEMQKVLVAWEAEFTAWAAGQLREQLHAKKAADKATAVALANKAPREEW
jgi:hypothetical protein